MDEPFDIIGPLRAVKSIAVGRSVRSREQLSAEFGHGRWKKVKGFALIRYIGGRICEAEIHWYEATGIGRKEFKIKRLVE